MHPLLGITLLLLMAVTSVPGSPLRTRAPQLQTGTVSDTETTSAPAENVTDATVTPEETTVSPEVTEIAQNATLEAAAINSPSTTTQSTTTSTSTNTTPTTTPSVITTPGERFVRVNYSDCQTATGVTCLYHCATAGSHEPVFKKFTTVDRNISQCSIAKFTETDGSLDSFEVQSPLQSEFVEWSHQRTFSYHANDPEFTFDKTCRVFPEERVRALDNGGVAYAFHRFKGSRATRSLQDSCRVAENDMHGHRRSFIPELAVKAEETGMSFIAKFVLGTLGVAGVIVICLLVFAVVFHRRLNQRTSLNSITSVSHTSRGTTRSSNTTRSHNSDKHPLLLAIKSKTTPSKNDRSKKDGSKKDGSKKDGSKKGGSKKDGSKKDGSKKNGSNKKTRPQPPSSDATAPEYHYSDTLDFSTNTSKCSGENMAELSAKKATMKAAKAPEKVLSSAEITGISVSEISGKKNGGSKTPISSIKSISNP